LSASIQRKCILGYINLIIGYRFNSRLSNLAIRIFDDSYNLVSRQDFKDFKADISLYAPIDTGLSSRIGLKDFYE
jgi:hypothetical protein|tara:strand:- start:654 stop:878 length:225 start_codon:yes stop_codon:yes gene_type:complete